MSGEEGEETVTLEDVLEEEAHWEETTNAVLGGSDNKNCSYSQGYVKRQALYACLTCTPITAPNFTPAGICLACSLKCHDGHDLVELYTKRNFRCDCGNSKFPNSTCSLTPLKDDFNENNTYNQNFSGLYCLCHRPYPDPDEDEEEDDEMMQCIVCEDWLHGRHTGNDTFDLESEQAAEFICEACTKKNIFLLLYPHLNCSTDGNSAVTTTDGQGTKRKSGGDDSIVVHVGIDDTDSGSQIVEAAEEATKSGDSVKIEDGSDGSQDTHDSGIASGDSDTADESQIDGANSKAAVSGSGGEVFLDGACLIACKLRTPTDEIKGGTWWSNGWRKKLCRCSTCLELYKTNGVSFLIDEEDTLEAYEAKGLKDGVSTFDSTQVLMQNVLSQLDRVGQIEFLHKYNELKDSLREFLRTIGESGRAVTAADIHEFFGEMQAAKRRRLDDVYVPDNCH